jgi:cytochrome c oxidase cbb3-type subunit I/II
MSLKSVNALTHYTDWTVAHVHIGAMGWNGFLTFGMLYWLIPRLFKTKLYSSKMANTHFWLGTLGIIFYAIPLYWGAIVQTLMWKEFTADGFLRYPNFLETVTQIMPMYHTRIVGGTLYIVGFLFMLVNIIKTIKAGQFESEETVSAPVLQKASTKRTSGEGWHRWLERRPVQFMILSLVAILIGGLVEIIPTYLIKSNVPTISSVQPYTPLELQGRDIYVREGCYTCHSQMIRPFRSETERYGDYTKAGETVYNHPFQFGSKRNGPDLSREGVKTGRMYKPDAWHYNHMQDPRSVSSQSIMPPYPWLIADQLNTSTTAKKIRVMQTLGVPYPESYDVIANEDLMKQANQIADGLKQSGIEVEADREIIAIIAYLQRLGTDIYKTDQ